MPRERLAIPQVVYESSGVRENWFSVYKQVAAISHEFRRISIEGPRLPKAGQPAIAVMVPHTDHIDPPLLYSLGVFHSGDPHQKTGRTMRVVAVNYMVDPTIPLPHPEPPPHNRVEAYLRQKRRQLFCFASSIGDPIPITPSDPIDKIFDPIDEHLQQGGIVGMALQSEKKRWSEKNPAKLLAASVALRHPNVPLYLVGIEGIHRLRGPIHVRISEPLTGHPYTGSPRRGLLDLHNRLIDLAQVVAPHYDIENLKR